MNTLQDGCFTTYDLPLAATMVARGHTISDIDREDTGRAKFCFKRSDKLRLDVTAFWKQELLISPKVLFESFKFVKSLLYSGGDQ